jgi:hypothetical protein
MGKSAAYIRENLTCTALIKQPEPLAELLPQEGLHAVEQRELLLPSAHYFCFSPKILISSRRVANSGKFYRNFTA